MATKASAAQSGDGDTGSVTAGSGNRASARPSAKLAGKPAGRAAGKPEADCKARRYDPAETRTRVLEAAYVLFGTRGYSNTGTADIARAADVSEGSIFYHFGSKHALLVELGKLHGLKMVDAMQAGDPLEALSFETTLNRCFDFCEVNTVWDHTVGGGECAASTLSATHKTLKKNPDAEPFFHATREIVVGWTKAHMDAVAARHGATPVDTRIAASLIFALVGDAIQMYFNPVASDEDRKRIRTECIRFCTAAAGHPLAERS